MDFSSWSGAVGRALQSSRPDVKMLDLDPNYLKSAFQSGVSPVIFVKQLPPKPVPSPPVPKTLPWDDARARQAPQVLNDPKYLLDTGFGIGCPRCGSRSLLKMAKQGSGLMYFGSLSWVITMGLVEAGVASMKSQPFKCGYCQTEFTL